MTPLLLERPRRAWQRQQQVSLHCSQVAVMGEKNQHETVSSLVRLFIYRHHEKNHNFLYENVSTLFQQYVVDTALNLGFCYTEFEINHQMFSVFWFT